MSEDTTTTHQDSKVIVYSTSWCAFCHTEMEWLKKLGVEYVAKDIEAEPAARDELLGKNGGNFQGVPVTDINGELINLYRVVKHHLEELVRQFKWCLISREMFDWLKETPPEPLTDNEITMVHGVSFAMP